MDRRPSGPAVRASRRSSDIPSPSLSPSLPLLARAILLVGPVLLLAHQLGRGWCGHSGVTGDGLGDRGLHVLLLGGTPWVSLALWRASTEGVGAVLRGVEATTLLGASALLLLQTLLAVLALQHTSPITLIATSITAITLIACLRSGNGHGSHGSAAEEGSMGRKLGLGMCGMTLAGAALHEAVRAGGSSTASAILALHLSLIFLASRSSASAISPPPAKERSGAEASAYAQSLALQRVKQIQLWKAAGLGAGAMGSVLVVAWGLLFPAPIHAPSESTLLSLLLTSASLVPSLLLIAPTSRRIARSFHPLAPRIADTANGEGSAQGARKALGVFVGAMIGLRAVFGGQVGSLAEAGVLGMAFLAITFTEPSPEASATDASSKPKTIATAYAPHASPDPAAGAMSALPAFLPVQVRVLLKHILRSPESSKIFYFLLLNLVYMVVQVIWGVWTNSLGLISDAIHMAFDCAALAMGLFASVMATWPPDGQYSYGYGRVETLSGFANGVFLILISIFIIFEAVQRVLDPPEMMNMRQLLVVSAGGLGVNLWGMYATGHHHHGHSHDHGGHGHDHGHDNGHAHGHHHHEDENAIAHSHNMRGVFLHVLADTLGSVGVILSTILIDFTGWTVFDPIASLFIAGLIVASVIPLVIDSARVLMLEVSETKEVELRQALAELNAVEGLESYAAPRFWPKSEGSLVGSIHIQLSPSRSYMDPSVSRLDNPAWEFKKPGIGYANAEKVVARVERVLKNKIRGLRELTVQVEGMDHAFCPCTT